MTLVLRYAARSDRGLVRQNNQDSVYAGPRLLALADGMGGHAAGEVASKVVIAAFAPLDDDDPSSDLLDQLREAIHTGNAAISELVGDDPELEGMGTTLTAVLFAGNKLGLAHVGDSRAYLMREGNLSQITHDDTFVQSLIDEDRITEDEAAHHPQRSLLLKALTGHEVDPSLIVREARAGDRYLLCSDGLSGVVSYETLAEALQVPDPQACADRLIELALKGGGPDNVTCIVADVVDVDFGEHAPIVGGAAGDGVEDPQPNSSAARASATLPRPEPKPISSTPPDPRSRRRRRRLRALLAAALLVGLAGSAIAGYWWVMRQYYVSAQPNDQVAIYQGVRGEMLGLPLHRVAETGCRPEARDCEQIALSDLKPAVRAEVERGITVVGLQDARDTVSRLRTEQLLPPCSGNGAGSVAGALRDPASTAPSPEPTTTSAPDPSPGEPVPRPQQSGTPLSTAAPEPGIDCRRVER
ncbi:MAG: protein phosphatase [Pseudonocardiaceae bacterium]|nr:protein phosphatase [Pseudonocardiaceae bacterium]